MDAVVVGDHLDASATRTLRLPEIHHGGKVEVGIDHFVAWAAEVEARSHDCLAGGHVLQACDRAPGSIERHADLVTNLGGEHPPFLFPCANSARVPKFGVLV